METFSFSYDKVKMTDLSAEDRELCLQAIEATHGSYAPYSNYNVGAAIRLATGEIICGSNQENSSYPCGTCAERTALNYAQASHPEETVETIAVASVQNGATTQKPPYPCGMCRQSIAETEHRQKKDIRLLLVGADEVLIIPSAACLLPLTFGNK